jgi:hypothetical protein
MEPTAVIVLTFADGTIGRMQLYEAPTDANIQTAINRTKFDKPVNAWRRCQKADFPPGPIKSTYRDRGGRIVDDEARQANGR